jgi:hypothetical protein
MKYLCYDLEACFLKKSYKRKDCKILEVALYNSTISFQRLINPLKKYDSGEAVVDSLEEVGQHAENTVGFWTKLLIEKKAFPTSLKRKSTREKANAISKLLLRSDVARKYEDETGMMLALKRHEDDEEKASKDVRKGEEGFNSVFYTPDEALKDALLIGKDHVWIAHNGRCFDEKILKGHVNHKWDTITFLDSIPIIKRWNSKLPKYSQTEVYKHMFNDSYFAHHALEDAKSLHKILKKIEEDHSADTWTQEKSTKKKEVKLHSNSNLYEVKGIGPITVAELHKRGVKTREHLLNIVQKTSFEEWCKQYSFVHQHKKFWKSWKNYDTNSAFV